MTFIDCFAKHHNTGGSYNYYLGDGGALYARAVNENSIVTLTNIAITNCNATGNGGGIYVLAEGSTNLIKLEGEINFNNCSANNGGGICTNNQWGG